MTPRHTILVVDDEAEVRALVARQLSGAGYDVLEAASGRQAVEITRSGGIDLVIADVYMPNMDSFELIARLAADGGIPIITMAGGGYIDTGMILEIALLLGANHTLAKPFNRQELLDVVRAAL